MTSSKFTSTVPENPSNAKNPNPFASLLPLYEQAREASLKTSEEAAALDWIQNKPSKNGSNSQSAPVTFVLPISGSLLRL